MSKNIGNMLYNMFFVASIFEKFTFGLTFASLLRKHIDISFIEREKIMNEKIGTLAGAVWAALNENGAMVSKDLKKAAGLKSDKELYLAMGWLLREDKLEVTEDAKTVTLALK